LLPFGLHAIPLSDSFRAKERRGKPRQTGCRLASPVCSFEKRWMMKYVIQINQFAWSEMFPDPFDRPDIIDMTIFDYLWCLCASNDPRLERLKVDSERDFVKVNFAALIEELPILNLRAKASISARIKRLQEFKLIECLREPGREMYVRLTKLADRLVFSEEGVQFGERGVRETEQQDTKVATDVAENHTTVRENEQGVRQDEHPVRENERGVQQAERLGSRTEFLKKLEEMGFAPEEISGV